MFARRFVLIVVVGLLGLVLTACNPGLPAPSVQPTLPVSPLPTSAVQSSPTSAPTAALSPLAAPGAGPDAVLATPAPGQASVAGRLINATTSQPMNNQVVSLPAIICPTGVADKDKREQCVYAIDEAFDPSAITDAAGRFVFRDIKPGDYIMLVGNPAAKHTILVNEANEPLIWTATANQVIDVGDLVVDLR